MEAFIVLSAKLCDAQQVLQWVSPPAPDSQGPLVLGIKFRELRSTNKLISNWSSGFWTRALPSEALTPPGTSNPTYEPFLMSMLMHRQWRNASVSFENWAIDGSQRLLRFRDYWLVTSKTCTSDSEFRSLLQHSPRVRDPQVFQLALWTLCERWRRSRLTAAADQTSTTVQVYGHADMARESQRLETYVDVSPQIWALTLEHALFLSKMYSKVCNKWLNNNILEVPQLRAYLLDVAKRSRRNAFSHLDHPAPRSQGTVWLWDERGSWRAILLQLVQPDSKAELIWHNWEQYTTLRTQSLISLL